MGQKVNPHGIRVGVIKDWDSRWFTSKKEFGDTLVEDYKIRKTLKKQLFGAGVPKIEIERTLDAQTNDYKLREMLYKKLDIAGISDIIIERNAGKVTFTILTAKPGMVIGRSGKDIEVLKKEIEVFTGKAVNLNVVKVDNPDADAQLVAENIAQQLEKRISFRREMKKCLGSAMKAGAKGIKIKVSGRLGGADIARTEGYHEGSIPLQTLRANIDYGFAEAKTTYGRIGVKVWIYKGQVLPTGKKVVEQAPRARRAEGGK